MNWKVKKTKVSLCHSCVLAIAVTNIHVCLLSFTQQTVYQNYLLLSFVFKTIVSWQIWKRTITDNFGQNGNDDVTDAAPVDWSADSICCPSDDEDGGGGGGRVDTGGRGRPSEERVGGRSEADRSRRPTTAVCGRYRGPTPSPSMRVATVATIQCGRRRLAATTVLQTRRTQLYLVLQWLSNCATRDALGFRESNSRAPGTCPNKIEFI